VPDTEMGVFMKKTIITALIFALAVAALNAQTSEAERILRRSINHEKVLYHPSVWLVTVT